MAAHHRPERSGQPERRRNTGAAHRETSAPYPRNRSMLTVRTSTPASNPIRNLTSQPHQEEQQTADFFDFFNLEVSPTWNPTFGQESYWNDEQNESPGPPGSLVPTNSAFLDQRMPEFTDPILYPSSLSSPGSVAHQSWDILTPSTSYVNTQNEDSPISNGHSGTYGSLDDLTVSTPDTLASGFSDGPANLRTSPVFGSSPTNSAFLRDMKLPYDYFLSVNPDYTTLVFDTGQGFNSVQTAMDTVSSTSTSTIMNDHAMGHSPFSLHDPSPEPFLEHMEPTQIPVPSQPPWFIGYDEFGMDANAGVKAFEPSRGEPFDIYQMREQMLNPSAPTNQISWQHSSLDAYTGGEHGQGQSPPLFGPQVYEGLSEEALGLHSHIFPSIPGMEMPRSHTGRTRKLTEEQRKRTGAVRKARACWACRLSKQRCSPCSSNSPCEQCKALLGKRRFVKIPCFNDPIESLHTFLAPDYLMGHFSESNIESFIKQHSVGWFDHEFPVQLSWGGRRLLPVTVAALRMRDSSSEIGFNNQSFMRFGRPSFVRRNSPPLGIPLASLKEMREEYSNHVQEVVVNDLDHYVSIAYEGQSSKLPQRLLQAICSYYQMSLEERGVVGKAVRKVSSGAVDECWLLQRTLELHITSTILEKSLILDDTSVHEVQTYLGHQYPPQTAPRCAQRQIKLAFYEGQQQRISEVLTEWGKLMQNMSNSDKRWTTAFCIFMVLVLAMDKMVGAAYRKCESKIRRKEGDSRTERKSFETLVRLTETELFERCKEIFHIRYKTRKGWNERINPIRDGFESEGWKAEKTDEKSRLLIADLRRMMRDLEQEEHGGETSAAGSLPSAPRDIAYTNAGRLASIFLRDFSNAAS